MFFFAGFADDALNLIINELLGLLRGFNKIVTKGFCKLGIGAVDFEN